MIKCVSTLESLARDCIPPLIIRGLKRALSRESDQYGFEGDYSSWKEALKKSGTYDNPVVLKKVRDSALKVKEGKAAYQRDSVLFDTIQYSWPLLAGLLRVATSNEGQIHVLDFGGSLGTTYYQNRTFLSILKKLRWCIVELPNVVNCGKQYFENEKLFFYESLSECMKKEKIDVVLFAGVLQFLEKPFELIHTIIDYGVQYVIIDRTPFLTSNKKDLLTVKIVPPSIYSASYPAWFFNKQRFWELFLEKYDVVVEFEALGKANIKDSSFLGAIFEKR